MVDENGIIQRNSFEDVISRCFYVGGLYRSDLLTRMYCQRDCPLLVRRAEPSDWERQEYTAQQVTQFFKICAYRIENRGAGTEASSSLTIRIEQ